jgi:hypothetical protein
MSSVCGHKLPFEYYQEALEYLDFKDRRGGANRLYGSVYLCPECDEFHVSSRRFTLAKRVKGRGKTRRGLVAVRR